MNFDKSDELKQFLEQLDESLNQSMNDSEDFNEYLFESENNHTQGSFTSSTLIDEKEFASNPYLKLLKNANATKGNIVLKQQTLKKYTSFLADEITSDDDFYEINKICHFKNDFTYPVIYRGKTPWMSVIPHEVNTMAAPICEASGDVLTFGLGIGYFAFMVSMKDDVKSVTIVDNDANVIDVFKSTLLPLFPNKEKIKIVCGNCIEYSKRSNKKFDYLFVDTYHTPEDGLPFLISLYPYINNIAIKSSFWIEETMMTYFRRYLIMAIVDMYFNELKVDDFDPDGDDYLDNLLAKFIIATKDYKFCSIDDVRKYLSSEHIRTVFKQI